MIAFASSSARCASAALFALMALPTVALAFEESSMSLPAFAASPQFSERVTSPWSAFSNDGFSFSRTAPAGFAGGKSVSFSQTFGKNLVLGVTATSGYSQSLFSGGTALGYDFSSTSVRVGYNMGRLTPFVTANSAFALPNLPGAGNFSFPGNSQTNAIASGAPGGKSFTSVGAGFDYAITNNLSFGIAVSAGSVQNPGFRAP